MIASMAFFTLTDLCLKLSSEFVTTNQITLVLSIGGTFMFWTILLRNGGVVFSSVFYEAPVNTSYRGELVACCYLFAPVLMAFKEKHSIPLLEVTLNSVLFLYSANRI